MTRTMRRYVVRVDDQPHTFELACGEYSGPLHVAANLGRPGNPWAVTQDEASAVHVVEFWAEHWPDRYDEEPRTFQAFGTGHTIPDDAHWVGTCDRTPDGLVWHLFELDEARP